MAGANIIFPECIICLNPLQSNLITPIKCGHVFHEECLRNWQNKGQEGQEDKCPLCKRNYSSTIKLLYEFKYSQDDNSFTQEPQTLNQLLDKNKYLKIKNDNYEEEIKELQAYNNKCQKTVENFREKLQENIKNTERYRNDYLTIKALLDEEKEKNEKNSEIIQNMKNELNNLQDFKNKFEMKNQIDEETQKIILNKDIEKVQDDFEKQFYKLLNDDDEKKGLREYFYVLQQKIVKLMQENDELNKYKKNMIMKEKNHDNNILTQLIQLSGNEHKRNYYDYLMDKKIGIKDIKKCENNNETFNSNNMNKIKEKNNIKEKSESKRQVNSIKLKNNNSNNNLNNEFKKIFNNPLKKRELTFLKK